MDRGLEALALLDHMITNKIDIKALTFALSVQGERSGHPGWIQVVGRIERGDHGGSNHE